MVRVIMDSARPPKKRKMDWLQTLFNSEFFGPCFDHKNEKKENNIFCIDCCICCCNNCFISVVHSGHRSLQILKFFNQELVCLGDIHVHYDCSEIQTCKVRGEIAVRIYSTHQDKTTKALRSNLHYIDCEVCGRHMKIQGTPNRFCSIACKVASTAESGGSDMRPSSDINESLDYTPSLDSGTPESPVDTEKFIINFDMNGNLIGPNKKKLLARGLALVKVIVGIEYDGWKQVPNEKKDDLWENILHEFDIPPFRKENVLTQVQDQWRTWKKNIRKKYFGTTREEILAWKDNVPLKGDFIPVSQWNIFVEREATSQKLDQRAQSRVNRGKKTDVHMLGAKSYAQVTEEWVERTVGKEDEGLEPNRVNLYLHARKKKHTGEFHPKVANYAARIAEIKSHQDTNSQADLETDAVTQILGKDGRGRTRGMGRVSKTRLKAIRPLVSELEKVKNDMNEQKSIMVNLNSSFSDKMDTIINLLQNRTPQMLPFSFAGMSQNIPTQTPSVAGMSQNIPVQTPSFAGMSQNYPTETPSFAGMNENIPTQPPSYRNTSRRRAPSSFTAPVGGSSTAVNDTGCYHIRDLKNVKPIALGKIEEMGPGKTVDNHPLVAHEAKVRVFFIYPGNEKEPLYLGQQGSTDKIEGCVGSCIVWPIYLLEKIE